MSREELLKRLEDPGVALVANAFRQAEFGLPFDPMEQDGVLAEHIQFALCLLSCGELSEALKVKAGGVDG